MKQRFTLLTLLVFLFACPLWAQEGDSTKTKPQFKLSVNYNSNLNYYGRVDSLRSSGVFPMAELWFTPSVYVNAAPIFVHNPLQSFEYAGTVATLGYQHVSEKWLTHLSVMKPFYTESARLVQSALKGQASASVARLSPVVNVTLGGDVKWSDKLDYGATAGLDHIIRIQSSEGSVLVLDPGVYAYAGTQQFSRTYTRRKKGGLLTPPRQEEVTETSQKFNILAYEATVPIIYVRGKVQLLATPSYIIPQNLVQVEGRPGLSEKGQNMFYATVGVKYSF